MSWSVVRAIDTGAAMRRLSVADKYDALGVATTAEECAGAALFDVLEDGREVASFAVRLVDRAAGRELNCVAAGGLPSGIDVTKAIDAALTQIAKDHGAALLTMTTKRPGLARKARALGWRPAATLWGREINAHQ